MFKIDLRNFSLYSDYGYPDIGRCGLGNSLLPWARCFIWCKDNGIPMIAPFWMRPRLGPYLRGELDKRRYDQLFTHRKYIAGAQRIFLLSVGRKTVEPKIDELCSGQSLFIGRPTVHVFEGMENLFLPFRGRQQEIGNELLRITKTQFHPIALPYRRFIGIHVRRGDFSFPSSETHLKDGAISYRVPIRWYKDALLKIREISNLKNAILFSDGTEQELCELLSLPDVKVFRGGSAITDMLALAKSSVVIASGSTFSMWASFLSQIPSVWYPGQRRQSVVLSEENWALEPEWDVGDKLPREFVKSVKYTTAD